jgi:hypothetical protein
MQTETTLRFYLPPIRIATSRKQTTNASEDVRKKEPLHTIEGNGN